MEFKVKIRRRGADPPKNESGMIGGVSSSEESRIDVNSGNGCNGICLGAKTSSNCRPARNKKTLHTRLLCPSAAIMLSVPDEYKLPLTTRGKAGQTSNVSLAGVLGVQ